MTDLQFFLAVCVFLGFVFLYIAAVGDDPAPRAPDTTSDL